MEEFLSFVDGNFSEVAIFLMVLISLIGIKVIISTFKFPKVFYDNKKDQDIAIKNVIITPNLTTEEKKAKIKTILKRE